MWLSVVTPRAGASTVPSPQSTDSALPGSGVVGTAVSITGIAASNGSALSVDWGDGTVEAPAVGVTTLSHSYAAAGSFSLKLVLSGAGGLTAERSGTVVVSAAPSSGDTPELFFSEYVEGSSNNKALEIYNPTAGTVDLTAYTVRLYANGGSTPTSSLPLTGTLEPGKTLVLIHASFTTTVTLPGALKVGVVNFNGDDAVTLEKSGTVIDSFGQVGFDPGTAWTGGTLSALDRTLRRKPGIVHGSVPAAAPAAWDLSSEWVGFPIDTFDGLGSHVAQ